ncbi:MAG TPA: hypothetical protein DCE42_24365 [Myxococcales bacterium]|nr:hypothetical protein [Deltaproteobacteria bacterium]HAA57921.1 hypothetical protein [Myxococcales bacterium]|tara:strand:+ start:3517 stop:3912 length:396 start_codon:yes stop_codon:yes gene_type:complete
MNIKGKGDNAIATNLLADLAVGAQSGNTLSISETEAAIGTARQELKDEFVSSSRGLANAERAVKNTFKLALESGWVRGEKAAAMIEEFLGEGPDSLDDVVSDIRKEVRSRRPSRGGYSSYNYTPRSSRWGT